jgi:hypothetical protein
MTEGMRSEEERWASKVFEQRAKERVESKEVQPELKIAGRLEDGSVAQIYPEFAGTENPVKLEFRKTPELGSLLYLEKPLELDAEGKGGKGFRKFFSVEDPTHGVKKQEKTVYLRAEPVDPEKFEDLRAESEDMREYLTDETLEQLDISRSETAA